MNNAFRCFNSSPEVVRLVVMRHVRFPVSLRKVEELTAGAQGWWTASGRRDPFAVPRATARVDVKRSSRIAAADVADARKVGIPLPVSPTRSHSSASPALRNPSAKAGGTEKRSVTILTVNLGLARSASARTDFASSILPWSA
jgi:hypothetical protein